MFGSGSRRLRSQRPSLPGVAVGLITLVVTLAVFYLWLQLRCDAIGRQMKDLEVRQAQLNKALLNEEIRWTRMKAPANLECALLRHGIRMAWPRPDQIVRLPDVAPHDPSLRLQSAMASLGSPGRDVVHE